MTHELAEDIVWYLNEVRRILEGPVEGDNRLQSIHSILSKTSGYQEKVNSLVTQLHGVDGGIFRYSRDISIIDGRVASQGEIELFRDDDRYKYKQTEWKIVEGREHYALWCPPTSLQYFDGVGSARPICAFRIRWYSKNEIDTAIDTGDVPLHPFTGKPDVFRYFASQGLGGGWILSSGFQQDGCLCCEWLNFDDSVFRENQLPFVREALDEWERFVSGPLFRKYLPSNFTSSRELTKNKPVYLSYSWADSTSEGKKQKEVVDRLHDVLLNYGYDVRRDITHMGYKDSIVEFMNGLGESPCVVAVVSAAYLKSRNCMYELYQVWKNQKFTQRLCPIVLGDAKIHDSAEVAIHIKYWASQETRDAEALKELPLAVSSAPNGIMAKYEQTRLISQNVNEILSLIGDSNTLTPDLLEESDFYQIRLEIDNELRM